MSKLFKEALLIVIGTSLLALATGMFYSPNHMIVGGFSGIGIILEALTEAQFGKGIPVSVTNLVLNIPLLIIALRFMGKGFILKTAFSTVLYSAVIAVCEFLPQYTGDLMLAAIYGGIISGAGLGFVLMARGSTGGVDLLASIIHRSIKYISLSKIIFAIDAIIMIGGLFVFGADKAMYGIISIFIASKCISTILEGMNFSKAAFIISSRSDEIAKAIMEKAERGVTALEGRGMYTGENREVLLCVFAQKEIAVIKEIVSEIDKDAFILVTDVKEVLGLGFNELITE
ncbi:MAG: YitT family protein [Lachnospiraceae bacterium]|nr:YitT family protein [Lachnospiraceae bacterium]